MCVELKVYVENSALRYFFFSFLFFFFFLENKSQYMQDSLAYNQDRAILFVTSKRYQNLNTLAIP
jgi:hypothetical protein